MWISPKSITANGTDCKIFLTNSTLQVESEIENVWLTTPGYNTQLQTFKQNLSTGLTNIAANAEKKINNATDTTYADLRRTYASIALAQWYKKQNRENTVFNELIDSNNITGLDTGFNQNHYEQQAWQHLYTFYYSGNYYYTIYGGVEMTSTNASVAGAIDNMTNSKVNNASVTNYVKTGNEYLFSTLVEAQRANIKPLAIRFTSLNPAPNDAVNISVAIENTGKLK